MKYVHVMGVWLLTLLMMVGAAIAGQSLAANTHRATHKEATTKAGKNLAQTQIGRSAPGFMLKDAVGKMHSMTDYKGKVVVLVWVNPACPFVQRHEREGTLARLADRYDSGKVAFILINSTAGAKPASEKPASERLLTLYDPKGSVGQLYGARTTPHVFIIDHDGKLAYAGAIDNDAMGQKKPGERENYADEAIQALLAGQAPKNPTTKPYGCAVKYPEVKKH